MWYHIYRVWLRIRASDQERDQHIDKKQLIRKDVTDSSNDPESTYPSQASHISGVKYEYDVMGRLLYIKTAGNDVVREYTYGNFDRVTQIKDYAPGTNAYTTTSIQYDSLGREEKE